jgi:hypothetical protein
VKTESGVWGTHGCTVLVSAFCGNELLRRAVCWRCDKENLRSAGADRQYAKNTGS